MVISCDVTTAYCLKIKWNNFVRRSHEKWLITDWHHTRNSDNQTTTDIQLTLTDFMKGPFIWCYDCMLPHNQMKYLWSSIAWKLIYYWRTSCQNSDNQTATFVQLNLMHYGGCFFHLMLWLHVASTSNETALVGDHVKVIFYRRASYPFSDSQKTTDIKQRLTDYEGLFHLMLRLHVASTSNEITLFGNHMKSDLLPTACCLSIKWNNVSRRLHEKWYITDGHHVRKSNSDWL